MTAQENESKLLMLINEVKAQRDTLLEEFDGLAGFEQQIEMIQSFAEHSECGLAFECLIWWYENKPLKLRSANALFLVDIALCYGSKTSEARDDQFDLSADLRRVYNGKEFVPYGEPVPLAPPEKACEARFPEVESRLIRLIDEVEAQRETILYEFNGPEDFDKQIASLRRSVALFDYRLSYERLICWYEQMPIQVCGPNAVLLVELALHFGYKTKRPEDARFDLSKNWLGGCTRNVFKPESPATPTA